MNLPSKVVFYALLTALALGASACGGCGDPPPDTPDTGMPGDMSSEDMPSDMTSDPDLGQDMTAGDMPVEDMSRDLGSDPDLGLDMNPEDMGTPDMAGWPEEVIGRVNITYWREDAIYDYPELHVHAVFSKELVESSVIDPMGWIARVEGYDVFSADDYWAYPIAGDQDGADADNPVELASDPVYANAGDFLVLSSGEGEGLVANLRTDILEEDPEVFLYELSVEDAAEAAAMKSLEDPFSLLIDGGDDVTGWESQPVIEVPPPWEVTSPDPDQFFALYGQKDLAVTWTPTPSPDDEIILTLETFAQARSILIEDNGELDLDELLDRWQFVFAEGDSVSLSRITRQEIPTPSGVIEVYSARKIWIYPQLQTPYSITPDVFSVGQTTQAEMVWRPGDFGATPQLDLGPGVTIDNIQVIDTAREIARFDVTVAPDAATGRRVIEVTGDGGQQASLPGLAWVVDALPSAGICTDAVDEGFIEDGAYIASDGGLESGLFSTGGCPEGTADGREQAIPLQMLAGQKLRAWARNPEVPATLYVVGDCGDVNGLFACTSAPRKERLSSLEYTAIEDEQILLIVDAQASGGEDVPYLVEIERSAPAAFTFFPERIVAGVSSIIEVDSLEGDFDPDTTLFDLGPNVTVESTFIDGTYAELTVRLDANAPPQTIPFEASAGGQIYQVEDALKGVGYVSGPADCSAADTLGALGPGSYEGLTFVGGNGVSTPEPCLSTDALGQEAFLRVDLEPSQTLRARVRMLNQDPVIYLIDDCNSIANVCADNGGPDRSEYLEWTAPEQPTTVYLVVDGYDTVDSDVFFLELDITP